MTLKTIPAVEARVHFGAIMQKTFKNKDRFVVEKSGIPMVVIINAGDYANLISERENRFKILDKIRARLPFLSADTTAADVNHAIGQSRKKNFRA